MMLKTRIKKNAADAGRAVRQLGDVKASIAALGDEDLLDLADIFSGDAQTVLGDMARAEMQTRGLSL